MPGRSTVRVPTVIDHHREALPFNRPLLVWQNIPTPRPALLLHHRTSQNHQSTRKIKPHSHRSTPKPPSAHKKKLCLCYATTRQSFLKLTEPASSEAKPFGFRRGMNCEPAAPTQRAESLCGAHRASVRQTPQASSTAPRADGRGWAANTGQP